MSNSTPKKLERIGDARLDQIPPLEDCFCGIRPVEYNVVVIPASSTAKEQKIGSIFIPDEAKETLDLAMQVGRIVAMSPHAFTYEKWPDESLKPVVGDLVWYARYGGKDFIGADGKTYRILKDKDIGAVVVEAAALDVSDREPARPMTGAEIMQLETHLKTGTDNG